MVSSGAGSGSRRGSASSAASAGNPGSAGRAGVLVVVAVAVVSLFGRQYLLQFSFVDKESWMFGYTTLGP